MNCNYELAERILFHVLPLIVSISFFLIADVDSPRGGVILVHPENLLSLVQIFARGTEWKPRKRADRL